MSGHDLCDDGTGYPPECTCATEVATYTIQPYDGGLPPREAELCAFCATQLSLLGYSVAL